MLGIKVVGGQEAIAWARGAADQCRRGIEAGLRKGARIVASKAKRLVYAGHPEHLEGDTGHLRQSITTEVHGARYAEVGTNVRYAKIHEFGGTIVAREHLLSIPVGTMKGSPRGHGDLDYVPSRSGDGARLVDPAGNTQYVLVREVTIPARPTFGPALEESKGKVQAAFRSEVVKAMGAAAR